MPIYQSALELILPPAVTVHVALLITPADLLGVNEIEPTGVWYDRVAHSVWVVGSDAEGVYIANSGSIVFPAVTGAAVTIVGWGIYTTPLPPFNPLLAGGLLRNLSAVVQPQYLAVGDQARFLSGALKIRSGT